MIFQEPMTSLNPVMTVGDQIAEACIEHLGMNRAEAKAKAIEMMEMVKIPDAKERYGEYPMQFSGGMRQRIMIAMVLATKPRPRRRIPSAHRPSRSRRRAPSSASS